MVSPTPVILLPLYIYPTPSAWAPLTSSLASTPTLPITAIINPNTGPGDAGTYPSSDYISAISELHSYPDVQTICYIHTSWANRAIEDVYTDISTCAGWANYTDADIHMSGIFFDEAVAEYNDTTSAYMNSISTYARDLLGAGNDTIVFNPGLVPDEGFWDIADYINVFENEYDVWVTDGASVLADVPEGDVAKSGVIVYGFGGDEDAQTDLVDELVGKGVWGVLVTTQMGYTAWSDLWAQFCVAFSEVVG